MKKVCVSLFIVVAGSLAFTSACGETKSGPDKASSDKASSDKASSDKASSDKAHGSQVMVKTPDEFAGVMLKALASQTSEALTELLPTKADLVEAAKKAKEDMPAEKMAKVLSKLRSGPIEGFDKLIAESKKLGIDWSTVKTDKIETKSVEKGGLVEHNTQVHFTHDGAKMQLSLRSSVFERGLVMTRPPALRTAP